MKTLKGTRWYKLDLDNYTGNFLQEIIEDLLDRIEIEEYEGLNLEKDKRTNMKIEGCGCKVDEEKGFFLYCPQHSKLIGIRALEAVKKFKEKREEKDV